MQQGPSPPAPVTAFRRRGREWQQKTRRPSPVVTLMHDKLFMIAVPIIDIEFSEVFGDTKTSNWLQKLLTK